MNRYLLDTNVISELRKTKPHGAVLAWLSTLREEQVSISSVSLGELQVGAERSRLQDPAKAVEIENWIDGITHSYRILPMDALCFRVWARLIVRKPDLIADAMIAATAKVHGLIVATRNERDFKHFAVEVMNPFTSR